MHARTNASGRDKATHVTDIMADDIDASLNGENYYGRVDHIIRARLAEQGAGAVRPVFI